MHNYDATIDPSDPGHHQTGQAARGWIALRVAVLQRITMNYSFVIQTVILVVTQAVPAESARGQ